MADPIEIQTTRPWQRVVPLSLNALAVGSALLIFCSLVLLGNPFVFILASLLASAVGCWLAGYSPLRALGLAQGSFKACLLTPIFAYFIMVPGLVLTALISQWICQKLGIAWEAQAILKDFLVLKQKSDILRFIFLAVVLAPLSEEILFRGFIYASLKSRCPRWVALGVMAISFSAMHQHWPVFLPLVFLGIVLGLVYEYTGSLWSSIILHALFNTVTIFMALHYPELILQ